MPDAILSRVLRLPGYDVYAWEADDATGVLSGWSVMVITPAATLIRGVHITETPEVARSALRPFGSRRAHAPAVAPVYSVSR